jgi:methyl-accepting chemotaxis protein
MNLLSRFKISSKLAGMLALSALAVCANIALSTSLSQKRMLDDRVTQLRTAVDIVIGMAKSMQEEIAAGKLTMAEAESQLRTRCRHMMFDKGQGYPAAYRADATVAMNAANPQIEGRISTTKDSNGVPIVATILEAASRDPNGTTTTYTYARPGETTPLPKLVFVRKFEPWNMVFAVGLYVDDIDADMNTLLVRLGATGAAVMVLMGLLSWLIARDILGALKRQQNRMQRIATGVLDEPVGETQRGDEIGRMAETLEMLRQTALTARTLEAEQAELKLHGEHEKREALIALASRFDASVGQLVGLMASNSTELESTAQSMTGRTHQPAGDRGQLRRCGSQYTGADGRHGGGRIVDLDHRNQPSGRTIRQNHRSRGGECAPDRYDRARACRRCAADRARRGADFEYRGTDQSARAQCDHRSSSRG